MCPTHTYIILSQLESWFVGDICTFLLMFTVHGGLYGSPMAVLFPTRNKACFRHWNVITLKMDNWGMAYSATYGQWWAICGVVVTHGLYFQCFRIWRTLYYCVHNWKCMTTNIHQGFCFKPKSEGWGLVSPPFPESLGCVCVGAWPVAPPMGNGRPFVVC